MTTTEQREYHHLYQQVEAATRDINTAVQGGGWGAVTPDHWDAYNGTVARLSDHTANLVADGEFAEGDTMWTPDGPLVVSRINGSGLEATEDGDDAVREWHKGPSGSSVRYERYDLHTGQRTAHGFVDKVSRRITQTG